MGLRTSQIECGGRRRSGTGSGGSLGASRGERTVQVHPDRDGAVHRRSSTVTGRDRRQSGARPCSETSYRGRQRVRGRCPADRQVHAGRHGSQPLTGQLGGSRRPGPTTVQAAQHRTRADARQPTSACPGVGVRPAAPTAAGQGEGGVRPWRVLPPPPGDCFRQRPFDQTRCRAVPPGRPGSASNALRNADVGTDPEHHRVRPGPGIEAGQRCRPVRSRHADHLG